MQSMDHLLEQQGDAEESKIEVDTDVLYTQSFFMGLVAGVLLEKYDTDPPN